MNIQEILLRSSVSERCDTELAEAVKMYSGDLDSFKLRGQTFTFTPDSRVNRV